MGDLNGDGHADLAVASPGSQDVNVLLSQGDGTFAAAVSYPAGAEPWAIAVADLDGDGKADMVVVRPSAGDVRVFHNQGDGTFATTDYWVGALSQGFPCALGVGDLDGDGKPDLALTLGLSTQVQVLLNQGNGTFGFPISHTVGGAVLGLAVGDLTGDGRLDLAVAYLGGLSVLLQQSNGTLTPAFDYAAADPRGVALGDMNGDGALDLVASGGAVYVLLNKGNGTFAPEVHYPASGEALALADLDSDGRLDVAVGGNSALGVSVLLNVCLP
jgi:hypothetical protein